MLGAVALLPSVAEAAEVGARSWRRVAVPGASGALLALALAETPSRPPATRPEAAAASPARGGLALGDEQGVLLREAPEGGIWRRVLRRGPVHDLTFDEGGSLWAATGRGLFEIDPQGRATDRSPAPGEPARRVLRHHRAFGWHALATGAGVFVAAEAAEPRWLRVEGAGRQESRAVVVARGARGPEVWFVSAGRLWRAAPGAAARRVTLPDAAGPPVDVASDDAGGPLVLTGRGIATPEGPGWRIARPAVPPGVVLDRLYRRAGASFVGTPRGLLRAVGDRLVRAAEPAGTAPVADLAAAGGVLWAVGARGLMRGAPPVTPLPEPGAQAAAPAILPTPPVGDLPVPPVGGLPVPLSGDPPVEDVHAAALRYLDLGPARMRKLWEGSRRRGWLPEFELRGGYGGDRQRGGDWDDAFLSGERRRFLDTDWGHRRDFAVSALLRWDLGDVALHPESVDVSREARSVLELRDDVLDEVTQLYFDRRRVVLELASDAPPAELARLRLRADELAAGLDAWTGGWWSRRMQTDSPLRPAETRP